MMTDQVSVEAINAMLRHEFPEISYRCAEIGERRAVAAYTIAPFDLRPGGYVSGPTQFALADAALWFATFAALGQIEPMALTSDLSIRFLRPATGHDLRCSATIDVLTPRRALGACTVWCSEHPDMITAIAHGSYALPGDVQ